MQRQFSKTGGGSRHWQRRRTVPWTLTAGALITVLPAAGRGEAIIEYRAVHDGPTLLGPLELLPNTPTLLEISVHNHLPTPWGIGGVIFDFMTDPGLSFSGFDWHGELGETTYYFSSVMPPQTVLL